MKNEAVSQAFVEKQKDAISAYRDDMNKIRDDPLLDESLLGDCLTRC